MGARKRQVRNSFGQAVRQQTHAMVIIHCNERYHTITSKLDGVLEPIIRSRVSSIEVDEQGTRRIVSGAPSDNGLEATERLLRFYLTYWLLQWDQFMFYQNGFLPEWIFENWLRQRRENYNFAFALDYLPQKPRAGSQEYTESRAANAEQALFRDGWVAAKQYYVPLKKGFALCVNIT